MGLSAAEKNRRKRERKKKEKEERRKQDEAAKKEDATKPPEDTDVEIEYVVQPAVADPRVAEGVPVPEGDQNIESVLRRFQERAAVVVSDDDAAKQNEAKKEKDDKDEDDDDSYKSSDDEEGDKISKRKLREMIRPSVAELKNRVQRPDLVEAHDVTAYDPDFLIHLKSIPGTVPVPRHWGRKRKYLQGKVRQFRLTLYLSLHV